MIGRSSEGQRRGPRRSSVRRQPMVACRNMKRMNGGSLAVGIPSIRPFSVARRWVHRRRSQSQQGRRQPTTAEGGNGGGCAIAESLALPKRHVHTHPVHVVFRRRGLCRPARWRASSVEAQQIRRQLPGDIPPTSQPSRLDDVQLAVGTGRTSPRWRQRTSRRGLRYPAWSTAVRCIGNR